MSWFNHFLHKFLASKTKHFMAWNWLQVKYATNLILMNINIKRFFLLQPPSLKDEGHPDHLQRFHHRCNHINIITGPGYIVKKWQKIQLSGRAQYNTASQNKNWKRQISVGACENLAVLLAVLLLPRLRNARHPLLHPGPHLFRGTR